MVQSSETGLMWRAGWSSWEWLRTERAEDVHVQRKSPPPLAPLVRRLGKLCPLVATGNHSPGTVFSEGPSLPPDNKQALGGDICGSKRELR